MASPRKQITSKEPEVSRLAKKLARDISYMLKYRGVDAVAGFTIAPTTGPKPVMISSIVETPFLYILPIVSTVKHSAVISLSQDVSDHIYKLHGMRVEVSRVPFVFYVFKESPEITYLPELFKIDEMTGLLGKYYSLLTGSDGEVLKLPFADHEVAHMLFAGTSGSGKTTAMQMVITTCAMMTPPTEITFDFCDFKASGLRALSDLPHVRAYTHDPDVGASIISAFRNEMLERVESGLSHPVRYLVIEELAELTENREYRDIRDAVLPSIGRMGREVNMRLIVSAQKPTVGVIGSQLRQQLGIRIVGRLESSKEASWVLNRSDTGAHRLPGHGSMIMTYGGHEPVSVQVYYADKDRIAEMVAASNRRWGHIAVERTDLQEFIQLDRPREPSPIPRSQIELDYSLVKDMIDDYLDPTRESGVTHGSYQVIADAVGIRYSGKTNRQRIQDLVRYAMGKLEDADSQEKTTA